jgi:hypothetical protein
VKITELPARYLDVADPSRLHQKNPATDETHADPVTCRISRVSYVEVIYLITVSFNACCVKAANAEYLLGHCNSPKEKKPLCRYPCPAVNFKVKQHVRYSALWGRKSQIRGGIVGIASYIPRWSMLHFIRGMVRALHVSSDGPRLIKSVWQLSDNRGPTLKRTNYKSRPY